MIGEVLTWVGRVWSVIFLLGVLVFFGCLAYGAWWDRRERRRRDVEYVRQISARLLLIDGPDAATVERIRKRVVAEARSSGFVR